MSQGPNVFFGFCDSLVDLLEYGEDPGPYWLKTMVMDTYNASRAGEDYDNYLTSAGITSDEENFDTPEAKLLLKHFIGLRGDWYEGDSDTSKARGNATAGDIGVF